MREASLGFERQLWDAADLLRSNMDPAEYKHVVLGLLFLKYISDAFEERRAQLRDAVSDPESDYYVEDPEEREAELEILLEDRDEYLGANVFWVPAEARWEHIQARATLPEIGKVVDDAMEAIEKANTQLRGVLPMIYARPALDKQSLGKLINRFSNIGLGASAHQAKDSLGRVYEYFLAQFASAEGKGGGEFYTPKSVVELLVEMLEPFEGRVFDPCCGSGGMFVQSVDFIRAHGGQRDEISIFGQEYNHTTWRLARMNLAIRGIEANLGPKHADSFREDLHPDLRADFVIANPPFNVSQWHGETLRDDVRWKGYGAPPVGNANYAWILHFLYHLKENGTAGFVMANGSMSSMTGGEGQIREQLVRKDRVDCMVALPGQLFYSTQIPVCLWFVTKDKGARKRHGQPALRDRRGEVLFIDARSLGRMESRVHRVLDEQDIQRIAGTYHTWRNHGGDYQDVPGFCKSAKLEEIERHQFVLAPGRYVEMSRSEDENEPFEAKMARLSEGLRRQMTESVRLDTAVSAVMKELGYDF